MHDTAAKLQIKKAQIDDQRKDKRDRTELLKLKMEHKQQLRLEKLRLKYGARNATPAQAGQAQGIVNQQVAPPYVHPIPTQGQVDVGAVGGGGLVHDAIAGVGHEGGMNSFGGFQVGGGMYNDGARTSSPGGLSTPSSDGFDLMFPYSAAA